MRSSPIVRSPLTVNTSSYDRRATSPKIMTSSPSPRLTSESPVRTLLKTSTTGSSSKLNSETYRVKETQHTYRSTINQNSASPIPPFKSNFDSSIDYSSNVSPTKSAAARRDSWDVLNKTKHMFSNNSLESLAKLTEEQLNTNLSYERAGAGVDNETHTNTQFNKFSLSDSSYKERNEKFVTKTNTNDYGYLSSSKFMPIGEDVEGAQAIRVSNKPDGYLGQPFEFESENLNFKPLTFKMMANKFSVDGSRAGSGNLEILVNGGRVTSSVRALGGQRFVASFTPHETGIHTVQITFNNETVPGECT
jgi:filamin